MQRHTTAGTRRRGRWVFAFVGALPALLGLSIFGLLPVLPRPPSVDAEWALSFAEELQLIVALFVLLPLLLLYALSGIIAATRALVYTRRARPRGVCLREAHLCAALLIGALLPFAIGPMCPLIDGLPQSRIRARGASLIAALEDYRRDRAEYPAALSDLTPNYLPTLPSVDMVGYSDFKYLRSTADDDWKERTWGANPSYDLWVVDLSGSQYHYWPSGEYPSETWLGSVTPFDGWAYVHE